MPGLARASTTAAAPRQAVLTTVHDVSGAPWWLTIVMTTLSVRLAFIPLMVMQQGSMARMQKIKPQIDHLTKMMREAGDRGIRGGEDQAKYAGQLQALLAKHKVAPWRTMVSAIAQIPVWMTFFFTLRGMLGRTNDVAGFDTGGLLWFPDLTAADPYYVLPAVTGGTFYLMASMDPSGAPPDPKDEQKAKMRMAMKVVAVAMVPLTASFESGVFVYWTTSNALTVGQTALLRMPAARAAIGMPPLALPIVEKKAAPAPTFVPEMTLTRPPKKVEPRADAPLDVESGVPLARVSGKGKGKKAKRVRR